MDLFFKVRKGGVSKAGWVRWCHNKVYLLAGGEIRSRVQLFPFMMRD